MSDGFDTHTHGTFLDRGCQNCKRLEKNITLEQVYSEDLLQTGAELEARVAELEAALSSEMQSNKRLCEAELSRATRIAELEAALLENGKAFAEYGDHVRQAGCYAIVGEKE